MALSANGNAVSPPAGTSFKKYRIVTYLSNKVSFKMLGKLNEPFWPKDRVTLKKKKLNVGGSSFQIRRTNGNFILQ